ncbi:MAG: hypothetical protein V3S22_05090, partial [Candidatus Neomarinimicrobiota bacterium]
MTAARILTRRGKKVIIYEKEKAVGQSRNGDFEGLENWIFTDSGPDFFESHDFEWRKLKQQSIFSFSIHTGKPTALVLRSKLPFFHIICRGSAKNTIDSYLYEQCLKSGTEFRFGKKGPEGADIIATGSKKAAAYIIGTTFSTEMKDQVHLLLGRRFAPKGYAYLIVKDGRGTMAAAFKKSNDIGNPLIESINYFKSRGFNIPQGRSFAARGSFSIPNNPVLNKPIYIGESGGFQDYLFGFGIRLAMASGIEVWIASGTRSGVIGEILEGKGMGTRFQPSGERISARRSWIAYGRRIKGSLTIDDGAVVAIL